MSFSWSPDQVVGCVLAGGEGRRFGGDKPLGRYADGTLLQAVLGVLVAVTRQTVVVTKQALQVGHARLVRETTTAFHPAAGLVALMDAVDAPAFLVVACDAPELAPALLKALCEPRHAAVVLPVWQGRAHPFPGLYTRAAHRRLTLALQREEPMRRAMDDLEPVLLSEAQVRALDPTGASFDDADTQHDLARLEQRRRDLRPPGSSPGLPPRSHHP